MLLQNTKLKPVLIGVSKKGISRVDYKTKEQLDLWDYHDQVLKNCMGILSENIHTGKYHNSVILCVESMEFL